MSTRPSYAHVHQINISDGGVPKLSVLEAKIGEQGLDGDRQRNLKFHGGPDRAVCLYSLELVERLQDEGHPIDPGATGENLTLSGLNWDQVRPGIRLTIGPEIRLEVTSYTTPCSHNGRWFRDEDFSRIAQKLNPGWSRVYAKVLQGGIVRPGDVVTIES